MILSSKKILSMNLKFYRQYFNLSQEKFAEKIGSNLVYINQLENCKRKPTTDHWYDFAIGSSKCHLCCSLVNFLSSSFIYSLSLYLNTTSSSDFKIPF